MSREELVGEKTVSPEAQGDGAHFRPMEEEDFRNS